MSPRDFVSWTSDTLIMVLPFLVARLYLATPEAHRALLKAIALSGLVYSLLILVEIRLSPQLHNWVYGYYQHSFAQHVRGGGFRPMVFLRHGLWVGMFMVMAILAAFSLARGRSGELSSVLWYLAGCWLLMVLFLSSNLGATVLAVLFVPLLFLGSAMRILAIVSVAIAFLLYPVIRSGELIPIGTIEAGAAQISEERAASFAFRLRNEDALLERFSEKPIAGWGGWGRNRIFNERGVDISVTDGLWIIQLGIGGWLRYIGLFGLLTLPLLVMRRTRRRKEVPVETMTLALIIAANLIYLIPNSALSPIGWMMAGALAGFVQYDVRKAKGPDFDLEIRRKIVKREVRYSRFPKQSRRLIQ